MSHVDVPRSESKVPNPGQIRSLFLDGKAGRLEALLNEGTTSARYAALICHPHPKGGGTMHNRVVYRAMKVFNSAEFGFGLPVLRFHFRGTGLSEGVHDGMLEWEDVATAIDWLAAEYKLPIIAAGFSFGAAMLISACCQHRAGRPGVRGLVALGLPLRSANSVYSYQLLDQCDLPKLFLSGDKDIFAPVEDWMRVTSLAAAPKNQVLVAGADHFFTGHLEEMQSELAEWLTEQNQ